MTYAKPLMMLHRVIACGPRWSIAISLSLRKIHRPERTQYTRPTNSGLLKYGNPLLLAVGATKENLL
jgi:hypothetical protein